MWQHIIVFVIVALAAWHLLSTLIGMFRSSSGKCGSCAKGCSSEPEVVTIQTQEKNSD